MKIVFIGGRDIRSLGGIESYMYNLPSQLIAMGHEPIVFCESDRNDVEWVNGFKVIHQKGFKSNLICKPYLGLKATIKTLLYEKHVDIIHYNAWPPSLSCPLARLFGVKTLMLGHGLEWKRSKYSPRQQRILKFMEWVTAYLNSNLIMCSEEQSRYFKAKYNRNAVTIPTAINPPNLSDEKDTEILRRWGVEPRGYFLFLGRLVKDKNVDYLITAYINSNYKDKFLVIAGSNNADKKYVENLHNLANGNSNVIFIGAVYGNDKEALLRNAYTFCIPSTIEGLSIALLEAMSYSLPVIASDIAANKEVLEDDKALWVRAENVEDLRKAIEYSVNHKSEIFIPTEYNRNFIMENYTWKKVAEKYICYLNSLK